SEPERGRRSWKGKTEEQAAVYANRRRIRGERGKRLLRQRGEKIERSFAHLYETGGMRRVHLRRHPNIPQASARARGGIQLGPGDAQAFRQRHAPRPTGLRRRTLFRYFAAPERRLGAEARLRNFHDGPEAFSRSSKLSNLTHLITAKEALSTTGC